MISVFRSIEEVPAGYGPSIVAVGNFDGVHRGHQQIFRQVTEEARTAGLRAVAVTFDPHPDCFLRPTDAPQLLTPMDERIRLLATTGIDAVLVLPFNAELASLSARAFVQRVLVDALGARGVHEGGNFRFGFKAEAGVRELGAFGQEFGFRVTVHEPVCVHKLEVSSSAIRALVAQGDMKRARWMLSRPFAVRSTPKRDRGVGTRLLVPTVNLADYPGLLPAFGVYGTRLHVAGRCFDAVTNVGNRPTFAEAGFSVETHILNFEPVDLEEGTPLQLEFLVRLREEKQWPTPEALKAQIFKDVARAQRYLGRAPSPRDEKMSGSIQG